ncbi:MAG: exosome complex RNA-binding protein Rrp4 [Candidatus Pacearchaeota archaeon]|jgi:exosome complex component RRP4
MTENKRRAAIPGEIIAEGEEYLPGENTEKRNNKIYSLRYGLIEESNNLVRIIPLSGIYEPRRGNVVIGKVELVTFNGWVIDIGTSQNAFLSLSEVPRFVNKDEIDEVMDIGDMVMIKIVSSNKRGIDATIKGRGLGKIEEGIIFDINSHKVPRVIGKEGSMIKLIKDETNANVSVGQNGKIWIKGDKVEEELLAKKAIMFISERSFISGLTEEVIKWFNERKK